MAVGAGATHVQYQFLVESLILGLTGGLTGIAVDAGISFGVSRFLNWPQLLSPLAMFGSALFSMLIGGYSYPVSRVALTIPFFRSSLALLLKSPRLQPTEPQGSVRAAYACSAIAPAAGPDPPSSSQPNRHFVSSVDPIPTELFRP
jgi:hypothetical protein